MNILFILFLFLNPNEEYYIKKEFRRLYHSDKYKALQMPCILPTTSLKNFNITSLHGYRIHPKLGGVKHHNGIDIAVKNADVVATASGQISIASYSNGYGYYIIIDHKNGFSTLYGHLSHIFVEVGQKVEIAQTIGKSGSTGLVTGEHIHYEVRRDGKILNPMNFILLLYDCLSGTY